MIRRRLYNPAQLTPDELKASFVAREDTLAEMLRLVGEQPLGRPCPHAILIGPDGMGKTTLGLRFLHAIGDTPDLAARWQPVAFHEESYAIGDLAGFWLAALRHLARAARDPRWADRADALAGDEGDTERLAAYALSVLMDFCRESGKRLVLFVENLDAVFGQLRDEREIRALHTTLIERPDILLLGSTNAVFPAIRGDGEPFREFFRLFLLEGLGREDAHRILVSLAGGGGGGPPELPEALKRGSGRLEAIRRLTGGNPRLLVLACRTLIESPVGSAFEDLERVIDEQTPCFRARIEALPIQARKVFHCLAEGWKPMLAREVAGAAKLDPSHAGAQLRQLVAKGHAREVPLPGAKRARYEVSDRLYNVYCLLRFSPVERDRLERLAAFLPDLFGPPGMGTMYRATLETLRGDGIGAGDISEWLGVPAPRAAGDRDFRQRERWLCEAFELAFGPVDPDDPIFDELGKEFPIQELMEKIFRGASDLIEIGHVSDVMEIVRDTGDVRPGGILIRVVFGLALVQGGRFSEAMEILEHVPEHVSSDDSEKTRIMAMMVLLLEGLVFYRRERYEDAIDMFGKTAEYIDSGGAEYMRHFAILTEEINGAAFARLLRREEAIAAWQRASDHVRPEDSKELRGIAAHALMDKGAALAGLGRHEEACDAWERTAEYVSAEDPAELREMAARALGSKGLALAGTGRYDDSAAVWQRASQYVRPDDPEKTRQVVAMMLAAGGCLFNLNGRHGEAEAACGRAADIDPTRHESWCVLAEAILRQDDDARLPEAEDRARRAVELAPENPRALHTLSDVLARRGEWAEALDRLEHALRIGGDVSRAEGWSGPTGALIPAVAAGHGERVGRMMEEAGLAEPMEPLWHAVRAELGEELEPLPAEIMEAVKDVRRQFSDPRR